MKKIYSTPIKLRVTETVELHELANALLCDDPECSPISYTAQCALKKKLGWTPEISAVLLHKSGNNDHTSSHYRKYEALVQAWAMKKLGLDPKILFCEHCQQAIEPNQAKYGTMNKINPPSNYGPIHEECLQSWNKQIDYINNERKHRDSFRNMKNEEVSF